ncbi:hemerythrin domain-containing protein [Aquabacterium sp. A7-Y]|uniref:hemerythrin domain-containing protein n=1 Tax=Aquabacterium sp. A7-Y TaxID=1349605 RepID=UPI00223E6ED1|nr:hemerythrin domain-containing protein [Aquabacterium sp. A7-Y]MCW7541162.1 hemerythrin domain-containing protein [Aquabacterium sp. A7-Y]
MTPHVVSRKEFVSCTVPFQTTPSPNVNHDALVVLNEAHESVLDLFASFDDFALASERGPLPRQQKQRLAGKMLRELKLLIQIEDEVFYPAVRGVIGNDALMNVLEVEHQWAMQAIVQISTMDPDDEKYVAHIDVLGRSVRRHIEQERAVVFCWVRESTLNTEDLGRRMVSMKAALLFNDKTIPHFDRYCPHSALAWRGA